MEKEKIEDFKKWLESQRVTSMTGGDFAWALAHNHLLDSIVMKFNQLFKTSGGENVRDS